LPLSDCKQGVLSSPDEKHMWLMLQTLLANRFKLALPGITRWFGLDVVAIRMDPAPRSHYLRSQQGKRMRRVVGRICESDQKRQGRVPHVQPAAGLIAAARRLMCGISGKSISFDRSHLKVGMRARLAEQSVCRGSQQDRNREQTRSRTARDGWARLAQQPRDTVGQRSAVRGIQIRRAARLQLRKGSRIRERISANRYGQIVATQFSLGAIVPRHLPDRGVVEQQGFGDALQDVNQVIVVS
jgi:hypothetical protein